MYAAIDGGPRAAALLLLPASTASADTSSWSVGEMPVGVFFRLDPSDDESRLMNRPARPLDLFSPPLVDDFSSPEQLVSVYDDGDMATTVGGAFAASLLTDDRRLLMESRRVKDVLPLF
jgi:hypothetical protein